MKRLFVLLFILILVLAACSNNQQEAYYEKGVEAYSSGDLTLAKSYFSRAEGYEDSDVYLDSINEIMEKEGSVTVESSSMITESIPTSLSTTREPRETTRSATQTTTKATTQASNRTTTKSTTQGTTKATTQATTQGTTKATTQTTTTEQQRTIQYTNAIYNGDIVDGEPHGYGEMIWTNGDTYEGEWLNGELNGLGTYTWANGETYSGEWENGEMVTIQTTTQATTTTTTTTEASLDRIYQNQLLGRTADVIKSARAAESNINAKIDDLIGRGGLYSSIMETYKNQLAAIQTDIANLNTLYSLIANAESDEELIEYEKALISFESVY